MMKIKHCPQCKTYTMQKSCPQCKASTNIAKPPKYSPEDRYGSYRRQAQDEHEN